MIFLRNSLVVITLVFTVGCTSYQMGGDHSEQSSYSGATLNSPVTDQNPHVGGDSSYPASVSDQGRQQVPTEKAGY